MSGPELLFDYDATCRQCGFVMSSIESFATHMAEKHGFQRVGNNVFRRVYCDCGKPGLYKVGDRAYCRDHKDNAAADRLKSCVRFSDRKQ